MKDLSSVRLVGFGASLIALILSRVGCGPLELI